MPTLRLSRAFAPVILAAAVASTASACGSRGPLDIEVVDWEAGTGGNVDASANLDGATANDGSSTNDASNVDAGKDSGLPPIINCGQCIAQNCGTQIVACVTNPACSQALQCVATKCLSGGNPDPQCILTCSGSDPSAGVMVLRVFTCILNKCGADCAGALGGLGGGGGGGGGKRDGG